jgi:hypothetical protein
MKAPIFSLLFLAAGMPAGAEPAPPEREPTIVVTGVRPEDAGRALAACLARHCPALEDITATLRYAEALFVQGNVRDARTVLRESIGRNRGAAREHPIAVAGLYRASARMAMQEGDGADVRRSTYGVERALRAGLPESDPHILGARLETAEMSASLAQDQTADSFFPLARFREAESLFRGVADSARAIDRPDLAALADLRRAMLAYRVGRVDARRQVEAIAALTDPRTRVQQLAARIALAGMDRDAGDANAIDRLIASLPSSGLGRPVLLYAPPIQPPNAATTSGYGNMGGDGVPMRNMSTDTATESFDYWADIGFWIDQDGHVSNVETLRAAGPRHWLSPVLASIGGRIYSPHGADELSYRVERYRYTSLLERRSDTRILAHSAQGRIEMIDITNNAQPAPAQASR